MKVAILVSGEGSTLRRFVKRELPITVVIADRPYSAYTSARSAHPSELVISLSGLWASHTGWRC